MRTLSRQLDMRCQQCMCAGCSETWESATARCRHAKCGIEGALCAGSCLVLKGNGADVAMHCVPPVKRRRMSITLRRCAALCRVAWGSQSHGRIGQSSVYCCMQVPLPCLPAAHKALHIPEADVSGGGHGLQDR